ncbi:MAG: hypothetical protein WA962_14455, partial [Ornithinimicrobium sp.]
MPAPTRKTAPSVDVSSHICEGSPGGVLVGASEDAEVVVVGRRSQGRIAGTVLHESLAGWAQTFPTVPGRY